MGAGRDGPSAVDAVAPREAVMSREAVRKEPER